MIPKAPHPSAKSRETEAYAIMATVDELARVPLWPGFVPQHIPVAIYDGQQTILFRHPKPPPGFDRANRGSAGYAHVYPGLHASVRGNSAADLNGILTATLMLNGMPDMNCNDLAALVIHEQFHVFQARHYSTWAANELDAFDVPVTNVEWLVPRRQETEAFRRALAALAERNHRAALEWTATALHCRRERFHRSPPQAVAYERGIELVEGLAQYVERKAANSHSEHAFASRPPATPKLCLPADDFAPDNVRGRCYAIGHAIALLLDHLMPGWPNALPQTSASIPCLDELLATVPALTQVTLATFSASETLTMQESAAADIQALQHKRHALRAKVFAQPGWRLIIQAATSQPLRPQGLDPSNIHRLAEAELLHTRFVKLGNRSGTIEVLNHHVLTQGAGSHPLANGVQVAILTGLSEQPEIHTSDGHVTVRVGGVSGQFSEAAVCQGDHTLTLTLS